MKAFVSIATGMIAVAAAVPFTTYKPGAVFGCRPDEAAKLLGEEKVSLLEKGDLPVVEGKSFDDLYEQVALDLEAGKKVVTEAAVTTAKTGGAQIAEMQKRLAAAEERAAEAEAALKSPDKAVQAKMTQMEKDLNAEKARVSSLEKQIEDLTSPAA